MVFPEGISYSKKEGFQTTRLGLIYELNRTFGTQKSLTVDLASARWNQIIIELKHWQEVRECFLLMS